MSVKDRIALFEGLKKAKELPAGPLQRVQVGKLVSRYAKLIFKEQHKRDAVSPADDPALEEIKKPIKALFYSGKPLEDTVEVKEKEITPAQLAKETSSVDVVALEESKKERKKALKKALKAKADEFRSKQVKKSALKMWKDFADAEKAGRTVPYDMNEIIHFDDIFGGFEKLPVEYVEQYEKNERLRKLFKKIAVVVKEKARVAKKPAPEPKKAPAIFTPEEIEVIKEGIEVFNKYGGKEGMGYDKFYSNKSFKPIADKMVKGYKFPKQGDYYNYDVLTDHKDQYGNSLDGVRLKLYNKAGKELYKDYLTINLVEYKEKGYYIEAPKGYPELGKYKVLGGIPGSRFYKATELYQEDFAGASELYRIGYYGKDIPLDTIPDTIMGKIYYKSVKEALDIYLNKNYNCFATIQGIKYCGYLEEEYNTKWNEVLPSKKVIIDK